MNNNTDITSRPTFFVGQIQSVTRLPQALNRCPIRAGGVLLYRTNASTNEPEILIIHNVFNNEWEDIGGRTDNQDETVWDTICRETREETNNLVQLTPERLQSSGRFVYNNNAKYFLVVLQATEAEASLTPMDFGNLEFHDGILRFVYWVPLHVFFMPQFLTGCVNFRLKHHVLFSILKDIDKLQSLKQN